MSFGAKISSPSFGVAATGAPRLNLSTLSADIEVSQQRLRRVFIENMPYDKVLTRFDKPGTLFYLDPPYWGNEKDYGPDIFGREDFAKLARLLDGIKGKFILSLNDVPGVRSTFGKFKIESVKTTYSVASKVSCPASEVLITNF